MEKQNILAEKILSSDMGRYKIAELTSKWMTVISRTDDCKGMATADIIKKALLEVAAGMVTDKEIDTAFTKVAATAPAASNKEDTILKTASLEDEGKPAKKSSEEA